MKVYLSEADAKRLGLTGKRTTKKGKGMARGKSETRCSTCGEMCAGETAERRHNDETGHGRFEVVL